MTRATCSLLIFTAARASRAKRATASALASASGSRNLMATRWSSCRCVRGDDDAHAAHAEHPLDAVLAGEDVALTNTRRNFGAGLHR